MINVQNKNVEAVLLIKNSPSIVAAAKEYNIPVIHYEIAPFRLPMYKQTAYMDFRGVNGNTEALARFYNFKNEYQKNKVKIFSKKELLNLIQFQKEKYKLKYFIKKLKIRKYKIGLAGQVYNDSNLIAFSEGFNPKSSLDFVLKYFDAKDIIVRNHPGNPIEKKFDFKNIDNSPNAKEFINRCSNIVTINSSVGIEAVLLNKDTCILGDSPFKFLSKDISELGNNKKIEDELLKLNFFIFGYLIPFENLFKAEYIRWRLQFPSEIEIYRKNLEIYRRNK